MANPMKKGEEPKNDKVDTEKDKSEKEVVDEKEQADEKELADKEEVKKEEKPPKPKPEDLLKDPDVARLVKARREEEIKEARKKWEDEQKKQKERADLDEATRLKDELAEQKKLAEERQLELERVSRERDIQKAIATAGVRLQEGAYDFLVAKTEQIAEESDLPYEDAAKAALEKYPYLVVQEQRSENKKEERKEEESKPQTQTRSAPRTVRPAGAEPKKPVDALKMTDKEYRNHREKHGLS